MIYALLEEREIKKRDRKNDNTIVTCGDIFCREEKEKNKNKILKIKTAV